MTSNGSQMDAVLLPNGDVYGRPDHGYYLGSILTSGQSLDSRSLVAEITIDDLGMPTEPIMETMGWRVRIVGGQGTEPIHGRVYGVQLRVVRSNEG